MWLWPLPVDLQGESMHLSVALRPDIATVGVVPAKRRRNDQLVQEEHIGCEAMLKFAAILTVSHVLEAPVFVPTADTTIPVSYTHLTLPTILRV